MVTPFLAQEFLKVPEVSSPFFFKAKEKIGCNGETCHQRSCDLDEEKTYSLQLGGSVEKKAPYLEVQDT